MSFAVKEMKTNITLLIHLQQPQWPSSGIQMTIQSSMVLAQVSYYTVDENRKQARYFPKIDVEMPYDQAILFTGLYSPQRLYVLF